MHNLTWTGLLLGAIIALAQPLGLAAALSALLAKSPGTPRLLGTLSAASTLLLVTLTVISLFVNSEPDRAARLDALSFMVGLTVLPAVGAVAALWRVARGFPG